MRDELDKMLDAGVVIHSSSTWSFKVLIVSKKYGMLLLCVNYRDLNESMMADRWLLPKINN